MKHHPTHNRSMAFVKSVVQRVNITPSQFNHCCHVIPLTYVLYTVQLITLARAQQYCNDRTSTAL